MLHQQPPSRVEHAPLLDERLDHLIRNLVEVNLRLVHPADAHPGGQIRHQDRPHGDGRRPRVPPDHSARFLRALGLLQDHSLVHYHLIRRDQQHGHVPLPLLRARVQRQLRQDGLRLGMRQLHHQILRQRRPDGALVDARRHHLEVRVPHLPQDGVPRLRLRAQDDVRRRSHGGIRSLAPAHWQWQQHRRGRGFYTGWFNIYACINLS